MLVQELLDAASAESEAPSERQYSWGELQARDPQGVTTTDGERDYNLVATKEYMIGRSRKSDIRIGHNAPMPYISSQHCRIFHTIQWAEAAADGGLGGSPDGSAAAAAAGAAAPAGPRLQAWLEDLSQNGTFINGVLVGRGQQRALRHGDRIEMVFPTGRNPPQPNNAFPIFTYLSSRAAAALADDASQQVGLSQETNDHETDE